MIANPESGENLAESNFWALRKLRLTILTEKNKTPFELHHGRKPRTELTKTENFTCQTGQNYLFQHQVDRRYRIMSAEMGTENFQTV